MYTKLTKQRIEEESELFPLALFGDEVEVFDRQQYMAINWSSECSPFSGNAQVSRFLIGLIPTTAYHLHGKVNVTLQAVMSVITASVNKLICDGVLGLKCIFTSLRGDWKFLCQVLALKVGPSSNRICFLCQATLDMQVPYTDASSQAAWRRSPHTSENDIWWVRPSVADLIGFQVDLVAVDLMHTFFLGVGRDACASVLTWLLKSRHIPGSKVPCRGKCVPSETVLSTVLFR